MRTLAVGHRGLLVECADLAEVMALHGVLAADRPDGGPCLGEDVGDDEPPGRHRLARRHPVVAQAELIQDHIGARVRRSHPRVLDARDRHVLDDPTVVEALQARGDLGRALDERVRRHVEDARSRSREDRLARRPRRWVNDDRQEPGARDVSQEAGCRDERRRLALRRAVRLESPSRVWPLTV